LILGAVQEAVLENSLDIFAQNGFHVRFDTDASPGHRAFLTAVPSLHNWQLDANDMDEMLGVLAQFPGSMYRPSKLRRLFASKACRKSIMIGQALTIRKMEQIISNLGTLDHPWNCPHGRPTLRHLSRLSDAPGVVAE